MKETSNYYRIKTEWTKEAADGQLQKTKTEELVYATSYSEAEAVAYALLEAENREQYSDATIEIVKTKISEMLFNETLDHDDKLIGGLVCNLPIVFTSISRTQCRNISSVTSNSTRLKLSSGRLQCRSRNKQNLINDIQTFWKAFEHSM